MLFGSCTNKQKMLFIPNIFRKLMLTLVMELVEKIVAVRFDLEG